MPLGTLDRTPPPFFRQGPSALTKLVFFSALALFLMVADARLRIVEPLRAGLAMALLPVQRVLAVPVQMVRSALDYGQGLEQAVQREREMRERLVEQADRAAQVEQLRAEATRLRALLEMRPALTVRSQAADVMYEAADPFSRKLFIDRGATQGVVAGSPVVNEAGVLGQVTRVYPLSSEVTLLVDADAAIPVLNVRTTQRSVAFGGARAPGGLDAMELRFMSGNADVQPADRLVTSGLDAVYPPGLAVATVRAVERKGDAGFARILLDPAARAEGVRHVLVLEPVGAQLPRTPPPPEAASAARPAKAERSDKGPRR